MNHNTKPLLFWAGMVLLILPGLLHAYLLMPFPGSQDINAITICYYLEKIVLPLRIIGAILLIIYFIRFFANNTRKHKIIKVSVIIICLGSFYFTDYMFKAEVMFKETQKARFANGLANKVPQSYLVIGVVSNGVAKAYPIIYLGYHHKVQDSLAGKPVLVTYCTMCRTGRVYDPVIKGIEQTFRLVGARHYNAIIEDVSTRTWWYQATGVAAVGPMKGAHLEELPYEQMTLGAWLSRYPASLIMQPDGGYLDDYIDLKDYDHKQAVDKDSTLKNKDSLVRKSWMVGIIANGKPKAYDWRQLVKKQILNDKLNGTPLVIAVEEDQQSFHTWSSLVDGKQLHFMMDKDNCLADQETASIWDWKGKCISGPNKGKQLSTIQSYQEYWRSWKQFHPATELWRGM
ncbi:DUF3179 domain-containing (seleno)protein [Mucilaginibacter psychrotolerans]|uniref:DUF3179 domain-containing protein n=1 Tax=Mucilaginibacter psychrotolerans TaxID=1524096 RepID=A0A4Y8SGB1_9SPHI|nr:DUF3179 domain-containing (seleno)protein [Mucilaginibacter psychrotolerans]TFF38049.1 DUF3179 domain-containing protein [Mucilaginibacter psychrotolerans]